MLLRRTLIATAAGLLASFGAYAQNIVLKAADVHPAGYPTVVAVENMGKKLEAATNGRIKMQMFPGAVLGQREGNRSSRPSSARSRSLRISLGPVGPVVPDVNVFNMPFVFRDVRPTCAR
jgi:TRAP-type C4-dicarboxylate transport system substrate-binding protein